MTKNNWLLYGAYGYTGELIAHEAVQRGHRPVLAGRNESKLAALAQLLGLEYLVLKLDDADTLTQTVGKFELVFHAAGPFVHTHQAMVEACLQGQTHYLDITGEVLVFERNLACHAQAQAQGIAIISGAGFDVVPTNCLATYVAQQIADPTQLKIGIVTESAVSRGTTKSMLDHVSEGVWLRKDGLLVSHPVGQLPGIRAAFADGERALIPANWGDVTTAYQSTGIKNITAYMAYPPVMALMMRSFGPLAMGLFSYNPIKQAAKKLVEKTVKGPNEQTRHTARCHVWAWAANDAGQEFEAWLETPEAYHYTALVGVRCVEETLTQQPRGVLAPAQAFGTEFILDIPGTQRHHHSNTNQSSMA